MSYETKLKNYNKSDTPSLKTSERLWLENEFKKLEQTIKSIMDRLKEIEAKLP